MEPNLFGFLDFDLWSNYFSINCIMFVYYRDFKVCVVHVTI